MDGIGVGGPLDGPSDQGTGEDTIANDPPPRRRGRVVRAVALVGAGVLAVGVVVSAMHDDATAGNAAATTAVQQQGDASAGGNVDDPGVTGRPRMGGLAGETRVAGTVTAVAADSITVTPPGGAAATYSVTSATDVVRDGAVVPLTAIKAGDAVLVHVLPGGGDGTAERILAGTSATAGPRGRLGGPPPEFTSPEQIAPGQPRPEQTMPDQTAPEPTAPTGGAGTTTTLT